jgi:signal transduction histidine kinase
MALGTLNMQSKFKSHAEAAMHDMDSIVERCQQVDHFEHEKFVPEVQRCRVDDIISELTDRLVPKRFAIEIASLPHLDTDEQLLRIILGNLLGNALKYSPPESLIDIHSGPARHGGKPGILITVQNLPGDAGMPDPKRIFKKYYRSPGAHGKSGSGLGLYLAHSLAEMLGGKLRYEAVQEKVAFALWMPC